jgi:translocation and assembly module TamB
MDNLTLVLKIETKEALRLKQGPINIRLKPDFTINKDKGGELLYLGSVELRKGGTYIFQEKRFVLGRSFVYFTGDVNKPVLDMKANYKSINHLITIAITGTPATPNINFSSNPSLTREQILSVILFDSEVGGDTQSGNDMMKMMGGAMAKAALADAGIAVDHLAFGEGNSIEVGKKLTNKITVIYINAEVPKVKLKYQHGKRTESVIGVSEESQSIDIIYKRDF